MQRSGAFTLGLFPIVLVVCSFGQAVLGQKIGEGEVKQDFLDQAPKGWAKYYTSARRLQGSRTLRGVSYKPDKHVVLECTSEFKQAVGCAIVSQKFELVGGKPANESTLEAVNPKYRFTLERSAQPSWVVTDVSNDLSATPTPLNASLSTVYLVNGAVAAPIAINFNLEDDWPKILTSGDFKLASARSIQKGGLILVEVDFAIDWLPSKINPRRIKRGKVVFDPSLDWVMRQCDYTLQLFTGAQPRLERYSETFDYEVGDENFPLLKRTVKKSLDSNGEVESEEISDWHLALSDLPQSDFTLTAFGFPEPGESSSRSWYLWIGLAGAACIAIAFLLRRWVVRTRKS